MWRFAWRNLLTRPVRTALALIGLSIPILGVIGLFSLSNGLRQLVGDTLGRIQGIIVVREGAFSPVFSDLKADLEPTLRSLPGVRLVTPELWKLAPSVEGRTPIGQVARTMAGSLLRGGSSGADSNKIQGLLDQPVIVGQDPTKRAGIRSDIFVKALLPGPDGGRYLNTGDINANRIVISRKIARDYPDPETGQPRRVGQSLDIGGQPFEIVGIYDTGSMFLDVVIIMDMTTARRLLQVADDTVSTFYIEGTDPARNDELTLEIERALPGTDARSPNEISTNFTQLMNQLDLFLLATVLLALIVGVVGIVNTMLMSTTERFAEFGVLRTNGWSRRHVLALVSAESAFLGLLAGLVGYVLALLFTLIANQFLASTGLSLSITPLNAARGLLLAVVMGMLGGLYPAWKASRMAPMAAIRVGAH
ncbi:MAG: ABC transporter permease [Isosphaeraceae bacterium]|jgi:putative ABC transport system permease protein|nr:MAG: ABC transporter permease [Isosphaeraceae bacterium]